MDKMTYNKILEWLVTNNFQKKKRSKMETVKSEIQKVHCLFEQSGTFKKEFIKLGVNAEDYDINNDFGETDHVIDLFSEIIQLMRLVQLSMI